jgi:hypothetical protein
LPLDIPRVRLLNPEVDAHADAMVVGQPTSLRTALGLANGAKEPVTVPLVMVILVMAAAPTKLKFEGCFQVVGVAPDGVVQVILNLEPVTGAGRADPLKMVAQLFAPVILKPSPPVTAPITGPMLAAEGMHGLAVLPRVALTTIFSTVADPPLKSGGVNWIVPFQTPPAELHFTVPGRVTAPAGPLSIATNNGDRTTSVAMTKSARLPTSTPR